MDSSRNPDTMTPAERDAEVASILAQGVIRSVRASRDRSSLDIDIVRESSGGGLELARDAGLSVAARPGG